MLNFRRGKQIYDFQWQPTDTKNFTLKQRSILQPRPNIVGESRALERISKVQIWGPQIWCENPVCKWIEKSSSNLIKVCKNQMAANWSFTFVLVRVFWSTITRGRSFNSRLDVLGENRPFFCNGPWMKMYVLQKRWECWGCSNPLLTMFSFPESIRFLLELKLSLFGSYWQW